MNPQISNKGGHSKQNAAFGQGKIDSQIQMTKFQDILAQMLSKRQKQSQIKIQQLASQFLKEQIQTLCKNYFDTRHDSIKYKKLCNFFNDTVIEISGKDLINPTEKTSNEECKYIDRDALERVIRLTNQSKIYTSQIQKTSRPYFNFRILEYVNKQTLPTINTFKKRINEYEKIVDSCKEQIQELKKQLEQQKSKQFQNDLNTNRIYSSLSKRKKIFPEVKKKTQNISQLKSLQWSLQGNHQILADQNEKLKNQCQKLKREHKQLQNQASKNLINEFQKQIKKKEDQIQKITIQNTELLQLVQNQYTQLSVNQHLLNTSIAQQKENTKKMIEINKNRNMEEELSQCKQNMGRLIDENSHLQKEISQDKQAAKTLILQKDNDIAIKNHNIDLLLQQNGKLTTENKKLQKTLTQIKDIQKCLQQQSNQQLYRVSQQLYHCQINIKDIIKKNQITLKQQRGQFESQISSLQQTNSSLAQSNKKLQDNFLELNGNMRLLSTQLDEKQRDNQKLRQNFSIIKIAVETNFQKEEKARLQNMVRQLKEQNKYLLQRQDILNRTVEEINTKNLSSKLLEHQKLDQIIERFENEVNSKKQTINKLYQQIKQLKQFLSIGKSIKDDQCLDHPQQNLEEFEYLCRKIQGLAKEEQGNAMNRQNVFADNKQLSNRLILKDKQIQLLNIKFKNLMQSGSFTNKNNKELLLDKEKMKKAIQLSKQHTSKLQKQLDQKNQTIKLLSGFYTQIKQQYQRKLQQLKKCIKREKTAEDKCTFLESICMEFQIINLANFSQKLLKIQTQYQKYRQRWKQEPIK